MSVLINMEMPKCCFDCPCYHRRADYGYYDYEICGASKTVFNDGYASVSGHKDKINPFEARLNNCPLIPVPPHGRLIDADALLEEFALPDNLLDPEKVLMHITGVRATIQTSPTIIPAEEGKA